MPDFSTASNYSIQTGPPAKDRQAIKEDPSDNIHTITHRMLDDRANASHYATRQQGDRIAAQQTQDDNK